MHPPRWYTIPVRVALLTFIGTLLLFAVSLLIGIIGTVAAATLHHKHPDMRIAYRQIALPAALAGGAVTGLISLIVEIRHYRQSKALLGIARVSCDSNPRIAN
jgi:uncharacterized BrkB/YihY/UPF0761 family membrane protein